MCRELGHEGCHRGNEQRRKLSGRCVLFLGCWVAFAPAFPSLSRSRFLPSRGQLSSTSFRGHSHRTTNRVRRMILVLYAPFCSGNSKRIQKGYLFAKVELSQKKSFNVYPIALRLLNVDDVK